MKKHTIQFCDTFCNWDKYFMNIICMCDVYIDNTFQPKLNAMIIFGNCNSIIH